MSAIGVSDPVKCVTPAAAPVSQGSPQIAVQPPVHSALVADTPKAQPAMVQGTAPNLPVHAVRPGDHTATRLAGHSITHVVSDDRS